MIASAGVDPVIKLLTEAFRVDPLFQHILGPNPPPPALEWIMEKAVGFARHQGRVEMAPSNRGAALWVEPAALRVSLDNLLRWGLGAAPLKIGMSACVRLVRSLRALQIEHRRLVPGPHRYLFLLGVHPDEQRRGLGSQLLKMGLDRADAESVPAYLETCNKRNVSFYLRHGFHVLHQFQLATNGPVCFAMCRQPLSSST